MYRYASEYEIMNIVSLIIKQIIHITGIRNASRTSR